MLLQKSFDDGIQSFGGGTLETNDALLIDDKNRRPRGDLPFLVDRSVEGSVPPTAPDQVFFPDHVLQFLTVFVTIDTQQDKRLIGMFFNERPLVRV